MTDVKTRCRHLQGTPAYDRDGKPTGDEVLLCMWTDMHPERLMDAPGWLQRGALRGDLWREGDCQGCPCFEKDQP